MVVGNGYHTDTTKTRSKPGHKYIIIAHKNLHTESIPFYIYRKIRMHVPLKKKSSAFSTAMKWTVNKRDLNNTHFILIGIISLLVIAFTCDDWWWKLYRISIQFIRFLHCYIYETSGKTQVEYGNLKIIHLSIIQYKEDINNSHFIISVRCIVPFIYLSIEPSFSRGYKEWLVWNTSVIICSMK